MARRSLPVLTLLLVAVELSVALGATVPSEQAPLHPQDQCSSPACWEPAGSALHIPVPNEEEAAGAAANHHPRQLCTATATATVTASGNATDGDTSGSRGRSWSCSNWAGSIRWQPSALVVPNSEEELGRYLAASAAAAAAPGGAPRRPLKVVGFAHSWAALYQPSADPSDGSTGDTLALHRLAGITALELSPDGASGTVQVLAGTSFAQLYAELHSWGLTLAWAPGGIQGLTVGGAVAVGFHGSQLSLGGVSSVVSALRVYSTDGTAHDLSEATDPEAMRAARMGLGVCGIVTRVTLPVVPQHHLRRRRWRLDDTEQLFAQQLPLLKQRYDFFHWYVHPATGTAWPMTWEPTSEAASQAEARPCRTALEQHEDAAEKEFGADGLPLIMRWDNCSDVSHRALTHAVDMEAQPLWNGEYYVPASLGEADANLEAAASREILAGFREVAAQRGDPAVSPHLWLHVRYVAGDEHSLVNPCYGHALCAAFELALVAPTMDGELPPWEEWAAYFSVMERVLRRLGGRPHHAKYRTAPQAEPQPEAQDQAAQGQPTTGSAVAAHVAPAYGLPVSEFWRQCGRFDPHRLMRSAAVEELLGAPPPA